MLRVAAQRSSAKLTLPLLEMMTNGGAAAAPHTHAQILAAHVLKMAKDVA
jgi:hypothetical protein